MRKTIVTAWRKRVKYISCRLQKNVLPYKWLLPRGCPLCGFDELVDRSELLLLAICSCNIYVYDTSTYVVGDIWAVALLRLFQKDCYNNITTNKGVKMKEFLKKRVKRGTNLERNLSWLQSFVLDFTNGKT